MIYTITIPIIKKEINNQLELEPNDIFWQVITGENEIHQLILPEYEILIGYHYHRPKMVIIDDDFTYHFDINTLKDIKLSLIAYLINR